MTEFDDKIPINFMNFLLCASFGICRVLQFEGRSKVFKVVAYESFKNLVPYALFEVSKYENFMNLVKDVACEVLMNLVPYAFFEEVEFLRWLRARFS